MDGWGSSRGVVVGVVVGLGMTSPLKDGPRTMVGLEVGTVGLEGSPCFRG